MNKNALSLIALLLALLLVSCSGTTPPMQKDYADAVTSLSQVDPYYRGFFRAQNGSNYSLSDQRRAYIAAMQTARTPVRASEYRPVAERTRLATRGKHKASSRRRALASRGKSVKGKKGSVAGNKASAKRRATASRRSTARRSSRRRG